MAALSSKSTSATVSPELRQRALEEIRVLNEIYSQEGGISTFNEGLKEWLQAEAEADVFLSQNSELISTPTLSFSLKVEALHFFINLPKNYPDEKPKITIKFARNDSEDNGVLAEIEAEVDSSLKLTSTTTGGQECLFEFIQKACESYASLNTADRHSSNNQSNSNIDVNVLDSKSGKVCGVATTGGAGKKKDLVVSRVFFWAHHIRKKHVDMINLAEELGLNGIIKWGWPGFIFAEGPLENIEKSIKAVKSWHWRQIKVKWQEASEGAIVRHKGMRLLEEAEFYSFFKEIGRVDIVEAGTGHPIT